jgi:hypothetical protein
MYVGDLVLIEFSQMGHAFYGYLKENVPFNIRRSLRLGVNENNSLKNRDKRIIWKTHMHAWQPAFKEILAGYNIFPSSNKPATKNIQYLSITNDTQNKNNYSTVQNIDTAQNKSNHSVTQNVNTTQNKSNYSTTQNIYDYRKKDNYLEIIELVKSRNLDYSDKTLKGGSFWIYSEITDTSTVIKLGFQYKIGKGWWINFNRT